MSLTQEIIERVKENSNVNLAVKDLVNEHRKRARRLENLFTEYKGEVPIKTRQLPDPDKVNNKLNNDYRGLIVDQSVGYLFGKPITYVLDKEAYSTEEEYNKNARILKHFNRLNNINELDADTGKYAGTCGYCGRLLFIDKNGEERACLVPPWECMFIVNQATGDTQLAARIFDVFIQENGGTVARTKVELYDDNNVTVYLQDSKGNYDILEEPQPHLFNGIPLIKFANNPEEQGDFEKVAPLIDAYDKTLSDAQNEIEEFRLAYLMITGADIDEDTLTRARQTGALKIPEGGEAKFLTKELQTDFVENQKSTLKDNIYRFARAVDMADEGFAGGNISGEARKWKLLALENKAITKERKFTRALYEQFKVLTSAWQKKGYNINPEDMEYTFHRSLPVDLQYQAELAGKLRGHVSERTRLENLDIVSDVDEELRRMEEDMQAYQDLDNVDVE